MTKIKLCGLSQPEDILCANELNPDLIGFVFWKKSRRYIDPERAKRLKDMLAGSIRVAGVFVDEDADTVAEYMREGIIDTAQLHGSEDEEYIGRLRKMLPGALAGDKSRDDLRIIKAFRISSEEDIREASTSSADMILLDAGMGDGKTFDWELIRSISRPYFLAGGLDCDNVSRAVTGLRPYGVDTSSGIETDGRKDPEKMKKFVAEVRSVMQIQI